MEWRRGRPDTGVQKERMLMGFMGVCLGVFVAPKIAIVVFRSSFRTQWRINNFFHEHCTFSPVNPKIHTRVTYAFNHANATHLMFNMAMIWVWGKELVNDPRVQPRHLGSLIALSGVSASLAESIHASFLSRPMVGASGVAMGLLGALAVLDPNKTWLMIFPIPGVTITSQQMLQATFATHFAAILWKWRSMNPSRIALKGHLGGLVAGYIFAKLIFPENRQSDWATDSYLQVSTRQWQRSFTGAWLAVYWVYLTAKINTVFWLSPGELGLLATKRRFIERTWREDF